ncbi:MAG: TIGR03936 family radical SAM-associated protein [Defluviitaleaceae bacterium]|nr:TIGR03936 family radical SAM-associated protein [Defluviitaleaceae bacterium]
MRIRLCFSKTATLRFIGHLDFLRVFQQTIRRADLPAAFSQGFNPHLLISFALPLPLGMESGNDYADITLEHDMSAADIVDKLNAAAPRGLIVHSACPAWNKAASVVTAADYLLDVSCLDLDMGKIDSVVAEIKRSEAIIIAKKTKKGVKDTNIRGDILGLERVGEKVLMRLSAGSARFLSPLSVAGLFSRNGVMACVSDSISQNGITPCVSDIMRTELYYEGENGELLPLSAQSGGASQSGSSSQNGSSAQSGSSSQNGGFA